MGIVTCQRSCVISNVATRGAMQSANEVSSNQNLRNRKVKILKHAKVNFSFFTLLAVS